MGTKKTFRIKPYARLLTMLGEQLIKNERIALIELIKNSYDADAGWVKVTFEGFDQNFNTSESSKIIIEDDGLGMDEEVVKKHWLNPATPEKKIRKTSAPKTKKGRMIQGEKGIGRFAILKLGRVINVFTKSKNDKYEYLIEYDFSSYDDEFLSVDGEQKELFIENLDITIETRLPQKIVAGDLNLGTRKSKRLPHGTRIEITDLKSSWSDRKLNDIYRDISRLQSIFIEGRSIPKNSEFEVLIYKGDQKQNFQEKYYEKLNFLLEDRSVLRVKNGKFNKRNNTFTFNLNGEPKAVKLEDPRFSGLKSFNERFGNAGEKLSKRDVECGSFEFEFYVFDFGPKATAKYLLDKNEKSLLKDHRIYLYRDGIRVYPYGEPEDDWLKIDVSRGTISAGHFLSNDQVVGYITITQKENPKLKDKTNREGLIDEGEATQDFITLIQSFLFYLRHGPYRRYQLNFETKNKQEIFQKNLVEKDISLLKDSLKDNKPAQKLISKMEREYKAERQYLTQRAETTEELAGVGLSVETASHDIMAIMGKVFTNLDSLIKDLMIEGPIDKDTLLTELQSIRGGMSFVEAQLKDIQLLFTSSKQRRKSIKLRDSIDKVERIYKRLLLKEHILLEINSIGSPLIAKTTDAVILQLLLNLFDNSVYWLTQSNIDDKKILITLDGNNGRMVFSDNGPGINKEDAAYIFEPFYTGKGEDGRGLGLYIAKQLLERSDYDIELAEVKSDKLMPGANFIVNLIPPE